MNVSFIWRFDIVAEDTSAVPAEVDTIMKCLIELEDTALADSSVSLDLAQMKLEIGLSVTSPTAEGAIALGMSAIRTAIHAAGGSTPDWPTAREFDFAGLRFKHREVVAL